MTCLYPILAKAVFAFALCTSGRHSMPPSQQLHVSRNRCSKSTRCFASTYSSLSSVLGGRRTTCIATSGSVIRHSFR
ncbi:hypothetical protein F5Y01DRAFT_278624 [Xylaria sp. FL0043]|nr:hypothetical protein F5Y01DRAFT_278624 [Xylaria sp. FL0043]